MGTGVAPGELVVLPGLPGILGAVRPSLGSSALPGAPGCLPCGHMGASPTAQCPVLTPWTGPSTLSRAGPCDQGTHRSRHLLLLSSGCRDTAAPWGTHLPCPAPSTRLCTMSRGRLNPGTGVCRPPAGPGHSPSNPARPQTAADPQPASAPGKAGTESLHRAAPDPRNFEV